MKFNGIFLIENIRKNGPVKPSGELEKPAGFNKSSPHSSDLKVSSKLENSNGWQEDTGIHCQLNESLRRSILTTKEEQSSCRIFSQTFSEVFFF